MIVWEIDQVMEKLMWYGKERKCRNFKMNGTTWDKNGNFLACGILLCDPNGIELIFGKSLYVSVRS